MISDEGSTRRSVKRAEMAESEKGAAASTKTKEKSSSLDLDFGKDDFFSSWKAMPMAENSAMDFDFAQVSKDKKKPFIFKTVDMDFNLDGDFGKMPSFNLDIDLDMSPPVKEKSKKEESNKGNSKAKSDRSAFAFDFDELGSFNLGSGLSEDVTKAQKGKYSGEFPEKKVDQNDEGALDKDLIEGALGREDSLEDEGDGLHQKQSEAETATSFRDSQDGINPGNSSEEPGPKLVDIDSSQSSEAGSGRSSDPEGSSKESLQEMVIDVAGSSKILPATSQIGAQRARSYPKKTISRSRDERVCHFPNTLPPETIHQETCIPKDTEQIVSANSVSGNNSRQDSGLKSPEIDFMESNITRLTGKQNLNVETIVDSGPNHEKTKSKNSCFEGAEIPQIRAEDGIRNQALVSNEERVEHAEGDSLSGNHSIMSAVKGLVLSTKNNDENQEIPQAPLLSKSVDKVTTDKERETFVTRSRFFMESEAKLHPQKKAATLLRVHSLSNKTTKSTKTGFLDGSDQHNDVQDDGKLASIPPETSRVAKRTRSPPTGQDRCKGLKITRGISPADGMQTGKEMNEPSTASDSSAAEGRSALLESRNKSKDMDTFSVQMGQSIPQNRANAEVSVPETASPSNMKITSAGEDTFWGATPPTMKHSMQTSGSSFVSSKFDSHKDVKYKENIELNKGLLGNSPLVIVHPADTQKATPSAPSLKRKALQESNANVMVLNRSKRLSLSPSECRSPPVTLARIFEKKITNHKNLEAGSTLSAQVSNPNVLQDVNMKELETPFSIETDSNVEAAEACMKELDSLCNMLRKKHEEVKELLARAVANNNKLLILNHPIYEENILLVQKFAESLT